MNNGPLPNALVTFTPARASDANPAIVVTVSCEGRLFRAELHNPLDLRGALGIFGLESQEENLVAWELNRGGELILEADTTVDDLLAAGFREI